MTTLILLATSANKCDFFFNVCLFASQVQFGTTTQTKPKGQEIKKQKWRNELGSPLQSPLHEKKKLGPTQPNDQRERSQEICFPSCPEAVQTGGLHLRALPMPCHATARARAARHDAMIVMMTVMVARTIIRNVFSPVFLPPWFYMNFAICLNIFGAMGRAAVHSRVYDHHHMVWHRFGVLFLSFGQAPGRRMHRRG